MKYHDLLSSIGIAQSEHGVSIEGETSIAFNTLSTEAFTGYIH